MLDVGVSAVGGDLQPESESMSDAGEGISVEHQKEDKATREWSMYLHLSLLAGYVIPLAGGIAPIIIWQVKKDQLPEIDVHGKIVTNWIISWLIYFIVSIFLVFLIIGIPIGIPCLLVLGILNIAYPIIGGLKASNGEVWHYPMTIRFIR
jgi:uncharacterized Tic20 family protein